MQYYFKEKFHLHNVLHRFPLRLGSPILLRPYFFPDGCRRSTADCQRQMRKPNSNGMSAVVESVLDFQFNLNCLRMASIFLLLCTWLLVVLVIVIGLVSWPTDPPTDRTTNQPTDHALSIILLSALSSLINNRKNFENRRRVQPRVLPAVAGGWVGWRFKSKREITTSNTPTYWAGMRELTGVVAQVLFSSTGHSALGGKFN